MKQNNVVWEDRRRINETVEAFNRSKSLYKNVISEFNDLKIGEITNRDEMIQALTDPAQFVRSMIDRNMRDEDLPKIGNFFKLKRSAIFNMLEIKERTEFENAVRVVRDETGALNAFSEIGKVARGKVEIDKKLLDAFMAQNTILAVTDKELLMAEHISTIHDSLKTLIELGMPAENLFNQALKKTLFKVISVSPDWQEWDVQINPHWFKTYSQI